MHPDNARHGTGWSPGRQPSRPGANGEVVRRLGTNAYVSSMMLDSRGGSSREDRQGNGAWKANRDAPSAGLLAGLAIPSMRRQWLRKIARWFGSHES
jgi:hypothetical protein